METKPKDKLYCGVDKQKIQEASPILQEKAYQNLLIWIEERYKVHVKKDVLKLPKPWTEFSPLRTFRFTNVKRYHDRETIHLIQNISLNDSLSLKEKIINSFLFRSWNKWKTMEILGGPWKEKEMMKKENFRHIVEDYSKENPNYIWFTNAFNTGGLKASQKFPDGEGYSRAYTEKAKKIEGWEMCIPLRMFHLLPQIENNKIVEKILGAKNQKEVFETIKEVRGFAVFLAYQVFVDLTYIPEFPFSENEFTVSGPGCRRGLEKLFKDTDGLTDEELLFWLRDNQKEVFDLDFNLLMSDLPKEDRRLTVMDLENALCELSKLMKYIENTGRIKIKYDGEPKNDLF